MNNKISYQEALRIFKKYDKNKNGSMDKKEFKPAFMELISPNLTKEEIKDGVNIIYEFKLKNI
jgi:Ca2+-binding EF-hand superfamily protein